MTVISTSRLIIYQACGICLKEARGPGTQRALGGTRISNSRGVSKSLTLPSAAPKAERVI